MTEETIKNLPDLFQNHICTIKKASTDSTNRTAMSDSAVTVVNFDKIPDEYARGKGWPCVPASNDALYIGDDQTWYFIEFKNGTINKGDLFRKIYDSLIMLLEMKLVPDFQFARDHIQYILVYNSEKHTKIQESESRTASYSYISHLARTEPKLFDIGKLEKYLFQETHTYTKELFEKNFIFPITQCEQKEHRKM